jgi:two-component SAPR family response regulator
MKLRWVMYKMEELFIHTQNKGNFSVKSWNLSESFWKNTDT